MSNKKPIIGFSLNRVFLTILALATAYSLQIHVSEPLFAHDDTEVLQERMTATRGKTILMSKQMAGGIQWNKPASIANVHATYAGSEIGAGLTDVLAIDAKETELYSSRSESENKVDLPGLLKTHRSIIDTATYFSLDSGTHLVTMVSVFNKKKETVGYVAMAWLK